MTPLEKKKAAGKARYQARYARIGDERARKGRTRPSDRCYPRITDGIPADHARTRLHATLVWGDTLKVKKVSAPIDALKAIVDNLDPAHFAPKV